MYARTQEHSCKNLNVRMIMASAENIFLTLLAQLQAHLGAFSGGSEITNTLSGM